MSRKKKLHFPSIATFTRFKKVAEGTWMSDKSPPEQEMDLRISNPTQLW